MNSISIDPGSRKAGVAFFRDGELIRAWLVKGKDWIETADNVLKTLSMPPDCIDEVAIERMQVYRENPVPPEDLITLSLMAGRVTGLFGCRTYEYLPRQWKGQTPKKIEIERIKNRLSPLEKARIELPRDAKAQLDVYDAIGIGMHHNRKLRRRRGD